MTKFEFIQEAALRLISVSTSKNGLYGIIPTLRPQNWSVTEWIGRMAESIADEVWKYEPHIESSQKKETKCAASFADINREFSINELYDEINRQEELWMNETCHARRGFAERFKYVCYQQNIKTVAELLGIGRSNFLKYDTIGPITVTVVSRALQKLYGINVW